MENGKLELYSNGGVDVEPILAFVDDIALFCRASTKSISMVKSILDDFSEFSGLQVNNSKSQIVISKRGHNSMTLAAIMGFQVKHLPTKYLGTPIMSKSISQKECTSLVVEL